MQMMNQYRPVEELPSDQNGSEQADPTVNGVQDVEMPLASSVEPEPNSDGVAQGDDVSADDSKMEE
jgi:hypothetical protein